MTFTNEDFFINDPDHDDPIVIKITIANWQVRKILIDHGSYVDVLYRSTFQKLHVDPSYIKSYPDPLPEFMGERGIQEVISVDFRSFTLFMSL